MESSLEKANSFKIVFFSLSRKHTGEVSYFILVIFSHVLFKNSNKTKQM